MLNFLGNLGGLTDLMPQGGSPGFAGGHFGGIQPIDEMGGINEALARNAEMGRQQALQKQPKRPSGLRNFLGKLGDALLVGNGLPPMYEQRQRRQRMGEALSGMLGANDPRLAELLRDDPETGLAVMKMMQPDKPAGVEEYEYYSRLPEDQRRGFENYLRLKNPSWMNPITMGPNDTIENPGQPDQPSAGEEITATGPNGEKVRFNRETRQWEPMGGQASAPDTFR